MTRAEMATVVDALKLLLPGGTSPQCDAIAAELRKSCATCRHFKNGYTASTGWCQAERKGGVEMYSGIPVPADGTGYCHGWEAKR
jgi:hypothetical protein